MTSVPAGAATAGFIKDASVGLAAAAGAVVGAGFGSSVGLAAGALVGALVGAGAAVGFAAGAVGAAGGAAGAQDASKRLSIANAAVTRVDMGNLRSDQPPLLVRPCLMVRPAAHCTGAATRGTQSCGLSLRGSSTSRSQSPSQFTATTVRRIATPGSVETHQALAR